MPKPDRDYSRREVLRGTERRTGVQVRVQVKRRPALFLGRDGRGPPDGGGALCGAERGPSQTRRNARGLALVERARPSRRPRRRAGRGRAAARALRRALRRSHRRGARSRKNRRAARRRDDRPPARRGRLPRPRRGPDRARPAARQTGAQKPRGTGGRGGCAPLVERNNTNMLTSSFSSACAAGAKQCKAALWESSLLYNSLPMAAAQCSLYVLANFCNSCYSYAF